MADPDKVVDQFFGDAEHPIAWAGEDEKKLHFWLDDLHCPQPISPMWFDVGGWWYTCGYMYRRFGVPFGKDWVGKEIDRYVLSAVVPRDPKEAAELGPYFGMVMPVYGEKFLGWWKRRLLPEILRNFEYLDTFPYDSSSLPELMILFEDALDIQERHFRLHWILNLAQFQSAMSFEGQLTKLIGEKAKALAGRILVSEEDRNWDSIRELWRMKEEIKKSAVVKKAFDEDTPAGVLKALATTDEGKTLLARIDEYKKEYGFKSMYTHEYLFTTWFENPAPIVEALRGYLLTDYDYEADVLKLRESRDAAIKEMWSLLPKDSTADDRKALEQSLDIALKMTPLTPDHHFYMDQGTYARVRLVLMAIGRTLVQAGLFNEPDDVLFLKYHELRVLSANHEAFDAKKLIAERQAERQKALSVRPRLWAGTITQWSLYEEPYKQGLWDWPAIYERSKEAKPPVGTVKGLGASAGVVEGTARVVHSPQEFDQVKKGEILVCQMTNPAWVVLFTKIGGLVTDSGGALSHPAVVSREFNIPAVVGTRVGTREIRTGQRVRVNGAAGLVEILA